MKNILRIVITGGPCAGKTTTLNELRKMLEKKGYQVIILEETATQLINANLKPYENIDIRTFQKLILDLQLAKENALLEAANNPMAKEKVAIIYDRGIFDNRAYIPHDMFKEFIDAIGLTEQDILDRYDLIIHMVSTAYDKPKAYEKKGSRLENVLEALEVEKSTLKAWPQTEKKHIVYNNGNLKEKIKTVKEIINSYIKSKTAQIPKTRRKKL